MFFPSIDTVAYCILFYGLFISIYFLKSAHLANCSLPLLTWFIAVLKRLLSSAGMCVCVCTYLDLYVV